ncbi:MAG TPA: enoyl-CoA hydratase family protein [Candidatus Baltobacteraceae bacterium]|nr:enoyl-CoA hydratase family protein [Candidatus Baltobacteraceae bacterium]
MNTTRAHYHVQNRVATVTLDGPQRKNPLTFELYAELRDWFADLKSRSEIKAVLLRGAGDDFCSGGDVREIIGPLTSRAPHELRAFTQMTGDLVKAMRACPQPIVAAVDGTCVGAGAILAMASDLRFGTARSKVAFLFVRVGLAGCDMGACAMLPRIVGLGRASELLYTGRVMDGHEALAWGFYNELCDPDQLVAHAHDVAAAIAGGPTFAHAMTKRMLHAEWAMPLDEAIDAEALAQATCMETKDFRRAYEAFVEKRRPHFEGD